MSTRSVLKSPQASFTFLHFRSVLISGGSRFLPTKVVDSFTLCHCFASTSSMGNKGGKDGNPATQGSSTQGGEDGDRVEAVVAKVGEMADGE